VLAAASVAAANTLPVVTVTQDNTVIDRSCRVQVAPDVPIRDVDGNGVLHIKADRITVEFEPESHLRGAASDQAPDTYRGVGVMIAGRQNVTLRGARLSGFWCAVRALDCDGLVVEDCDLSDNRRARLYSERLAESGRDWIYPHYNDRNQWLERYAAAIYVEDAADVTIRRNRVHQGQNALILDRVNASRIYDNDFSFNSGWGVALWRSNDNVLSRNACDFCVRGYSHGYYNRGQDSAGFLAFEQCSRNVFAENSATHSGDGFFGFAGRAALGRVPANVPVEWHRRRGNNDNLLIRNDFSYAPAHGIEMTFSFGNRYFENRLVGNAICGVWGGFSQDTLIANNNIAENGDCGYGLERGGVNIDSGARNCIVFNEFRENRCGVHLWWREDAGGEDWRWGAVNLDTPRETLVAGNRFAGDELGLHVRSDEPVRVLADTGDFAGAETPQEVEPAVVLEAWEGRLPPIGTPTYPVYGEQRPVGARPALRGRDKILMTQWGPWDHARPAVFRRTNPEGGRVYEVYAGSAVHVAVVGEHVTGTPSDLDPRDPLQCVEYTVRADRPGVWPYTVSAEGDGLTYRARHAVLRTTWEVALFKSEADPLEQFDVWRAAADEDAAQVTKHSRIAFFYAGPHIPPGEGQALNPPGFGEAPHGTRARTTVRVPAGTWRVVAIADDGVQVRADGEVLINEWKRVWSPRKHTARLDVDTARDVTFEVLHVQLGRAAGWCLTWSLGHRRANRGRGIRCRRRPRTDPWASCRWVGPWRGVGTAGAWPGGRVGRR
jgi:parallel beta-helix repeat protein